ncbi:shikimate kinase [Monaibacterium marinum]|uniref:Shikimate kinase n=2 Tax=Pontivivens marinum TaxID=1690039 RepID=A0A2C9CTC4_9RHOB|nr:shikimate kinase [Monaibacterium marinum]
MALHQFGTIRKKATTMNDIVDPVPGRSIVLIGLMGAGKTSVGKRLAARLDRPFVDSDHEIEAAAGQDIPSIFSTLGEEAFRDGERRVIGRLLTGPAKVIATGGGAWMNADTRAAIGEQAISVWLDAKLNTLYGRVADKPGRPLLDGQDARKVLEDLMAARYPVYQQADVRVLSTAGANHEKMVDRIIAALEQGMKP